MNRPPLNFKEVPRRKSDALKRFDGPNPFSESQAKTYGNRKLLGEFFPTSIFWSLFNEQHEILIGTRGSGKTVLLRMMSYSRLRELSEHDSRASGYIQSRSYIGFYVPSHLEFMKSLPGSEHPDEDRTEYFQYAFNCSAAAAILSEIEVLLKDCILNRTSQLIAESKIVDLVMEIWFPNISSRITGIQDLQWHINVSFHNQPFWLNGSLSQMPGLAGPILAPIRDVLTVVARVLGLDADETNWIACIDEAEFLSEPFIKCINSFMRSANRPLAIKMATLPFKHSTRSTVDGRTTIEPNGNDFNYRVLNNKSDSIDFVGLTNHICKVRLAKLDIECNSLEEFLGKMNKDDGLDYYKLEVGEKEGSDEVLLVNILECLSSPRRTRYETIKEDEYKVNHEYLMKFRPVFYVRHMRQLNARANRAVGWFAGSPTVRKVADGNPRRFLQLMNDLVQVARDRNLNPKNQHRTIFSFCERGLEDCQGLPDVGPLIKELVESVGSLLANRVHGPVMVDGGCGFWLDKEMCSIAELQEAIKVAIQYNQIVVEGATPRLIDEKTQLRLAFMYGVNFWLPLRSGTPIFVGPSNKNASLKSFDPSDEVLTPDVSRKLVSELQLTLFVPS